MNKRSKREVYKRLTRTLGNPTKFSDTKREMVLTLLGGWVRQGRPPKGRLGDNYTLPARRTRGTIAKLNCFEKAASKVSFPMPNWHWKIYHRVMAPKTKTFRPSSLDMYADPKHTWAWKDNPYHKVIYIALPVNYNSTVPRECAVVGRKVVQRVWNHRVYSDKETWECSYWDFSKLTNDENSHTNATWHEGFLVKMATGAAVETSLARAITLATGRTIRAGFKSVLSDGE